MNLAIIQARTGSTRLPGKVLLDLCGKTVLQRVIERVESSTCDDVIVAIPETDEKLIDYCLKNKIFYMVGDEQDVLTRFYQVITEYEKKYGSVDNIVRITADCPLIDYGVIDACIYSHLKLNNDYTATGLPGKSTYPDGLDVQVIKKSALIDAYNDARLLTERMHVTPYVFNRPEKHKIHIMQNFMDLSGERWVLDEERDYEFIKKIYEYLTPRKYDDYFGQTIVVWLLGQCPELREINFGIPRDEGYFKDLENETMLYQTK